MNSFNMLLDKKDALFLGKIYNFRSDRGLYQRHNNYNHSFSIDTLRTLSIGNYDYLVETEGTLKDILNRVKSELVNKGKKKEPYNKKSYYRDGNSYGNNSYKY